MSNLNLKRKIDKHTEIECISKRESERQREKGKKKIRLKNKKRKKRKNNRKANKIRLRDELKITR